MELESVPVETLSAARSIAPRLRLFSHVTRTRAPQDKNKKKRAKAENWVNDPPIQKDIYIENLKSGGGLTAFENAYASWG